MALPTVVQNWCLFQFGSLEVPNFVLLIIEVLHKPA